MIAQFKKSSVLCRNFFKMIKTMNRIGSTQMTQAPSGSPKGGERTDFKNHRPFLVPFGENAEGKRGCPCGETLNAKTQKPPFSSPEGGKTAKDANNHVNQVNQENHGSDNFAMCDMRYAMCDVRRQCRDVARNVSTPPTPTNDTVIAGLTRNLLKTTGLRVVARNDGNAIRAIAIREHSCHSWQKRNHPWQKRKNPWQNPPSKIICLYDCTIQKNYRPLQKFFYNIIIHLNYFHYETFNDIFQDFCSCSTD